MMYGLFLHCIYIIPCICGDKSPILSYDNQYWHSSYSIKLFQFHDSGIIEGNRQPRSLIHSLIELVLVFIWVYIYNFNFFSLVVWPLVKVNQHWIKFLAGTCPACTEIYSHKFLNMEKYIGVLRLAGAVYKIFA